MRVLLPLLLAACSVDPLPPAAHTGAVPLTPPWIDLDLPVSLGTVTRSDALALVVRLDAPQGSPILTEPWAQALAAHGYTRAADLPVPLVDGRPAFILQQWERDGRALSLQVRQEGGVAVWSLVAM